MNKLDWLWRDLRVGLRSLGKERHSTLSAVLALSLGIGSATIIFSAIYSILRDPVPYKSPSELIYVYIHDTTQPTLDGRSAFSVPEFADYREQNHVFAGMMGFSSMDILYANGDGTQLFDGCFVTPNSFEFLGVNPLMGRSITSEDGTPGSPLVFAMSYRLWSKQFSRDSRVLGTKVILNGVPRTLVAIMPPRFLLGDSDIWIPIRVGHSDISNSETGNVSLFLTVLGRPKPGVSLEAVAADFDVIAGRLVNVYPANYPKHFTVLAKTLAQAAAGPIARVLYTLMAAVLMLLLIACSNVANLLLARATTREREIAIRASLGATRGQLIRQLLLESSILAAAGCIVGCIFAYLGLKGLAEAIPAGTFLPEVVIALSPVTLLFAAGVAIVTTLFCGLAPAIHAARGVAYTPLIGTGRGLSAGFRHGRLRAALVVAEIGLSIVLLTGAGLMMRTLFAFESVDLGFNPANVLAGKLPLPKGQYDNSDLQRLFFRQVLQRVTALPGVIAATITVSLPPEGGPQSEVSVPGKTHSERWDAMLDLCSEGYFQTLGRRLMDGRLLSQADIDLKRRVAVVNQTLARTYFRNENPIGQTIKFDLLDRLPGTPHDAYFDIIGIVQDAKNQGLRNSAMPEAFIPISISGAGSRGILIRTAGDPLLMLPSVRREIWAVDSNVPLAQTRSLEGYLKQYSYAAPEFGLVAVGTSAGIGLLLVIIGVFSVMAYTVSLQTHDIGIRMALGAQQTDILQMVVWQGLQLIAAGVVVGLLASIGLTRLIASQIWGVSATDPFTFSTVIAVVMGAGLAACILPAKSAAQVDPLIALRHE
jgi:predicted permease